MLDYHISTFAAVAVVEEDDSLLAGLIDLSVDLALLTSRLELGCVAAGDERVCVVCLTLSGNFNSFLDFDLLLPVKDSNNDMIEHAPSTQLNSFFFTKMISKAIWLILYCLKHLVHSFSKGA